MKPYTYLRRQRGDNTNWPYRLLKPPSLYHSSSRRQRLRRLPQLRVKVVGGTVHSRTNETLTINDSYQYLWLVTSPTAQQPQVVCGNSRPNELSCSVVLLQLHDYTCSRTQPTKHILYIQCKTGLPWGLGKEIQWQFPVPMHEDESSIISRCSSVHIITHIFWGIKHSKYTK